VFGTGKPGAINVTLTNHGNVDPQKLPVPREAKPFYSGPVNAAYLTEAPVDKTAEACRKLLLAQGWQPYGTAGESQFFKQNAVRLQARVASAPAQAGKTVIDYTTELLSADLPAPPEFLAAQYSDATKQLFFDTAAPAAEVVAFYRKALAGGGWKATTDNLIKSDFKESMIFRNPQKDMLTLETQTVEDKLRVLLKHQSAAEVDELDKQLAEAQERKKKEQGKPKPKVAIIVPAGASGVELKKTRLEFKLASGKGKGAAEALRKQLVKDGWKEKNADVQAMFGNLTFSRENQELSVIYVDPGLIPAEFTISGSGVELEKATEKSE
jgi:hypothetical protein